MPKGRKKKRGIFAIEGEWESDLRGNLSFRPILDLVGKLTGAPYVHRDAATQEEFFYYLDKWTQARYATFPILYLGFHGEEESIIIGDGRSSERFILLEDLAERLEGRCKQRIFYFGSCATLEIDERKLQTFLRRTDALAICGYRNEVGMMKSAAFELLLLETLMSNSLQINGARAMKSSIERSERSLCKELGFRMVVRKPS